MKPLLIRTAVLLTLVALASESADARDRLNTMTLMTRAHAVGSSTLDTEALAYSVVGDRIHVVRFPPDGRDTSTLKPGSSIYVALPGTVEVDGWPATVARRWKPVGFSRLPLVGDGRVPGVGQVVSTRRALIAAWGLRDFRQIMRRFAVRDDVFRSELLGVLVELADVESSLRAVLEMPEQTTAAPAVEVEDMAETSLALASPALPVRDPLNPDPTLLACRSTLRRAAQAFGKLPPAVAAWRNVYAHMSDARNGGPGHHNESEAIGLARVAVEAADGALLGIRDFFDAHPLIPGFRTIDP